MLTAKQHELLLFIQRKLEETGISPSFEEMKEALDLKSKSGVHRLISALEERGFIRRLPNRARALEVLKQPEDVKGMAPAAANSNDAAGTVDYAATIALIAANDVIEMPLHGRIAAGMPIEAMESDRTLPVPAALLGAGEHYALEVSGDSMIEAGILDGDFALVKQTRHRPRRRNRRRAGPRRGSDAQIPAPRKRHDPARPGQRRLRSAVLSPSRGAGAGQARRAAAPLSLDFGPASPERRLKILAFTCHQPCWPCVCATVVSDMPPEPNTIASPPVWSSIRRSALSKARGGRSAAASGRRPRCRPARRQRRASVPRSCCGCAPSAGAIAARRARSSGCRSRGAFGAGPLGERDRLGLDPGELHQVVAGKLAAGVAQRQQPSVGADDPDMAPVARDQHVGRRVSAAA